MNKIYDVIIIGGGPSGLSAAIYAGRAALDTLIIEKQYLGGQAVTTFEIVNYPGIIETDGPSLIDTMRKQAESFGVGFEYGEIVSMDLDGKIKTIKTEGKEFKAKTVILSTGAKPRKVGFVGEDKYYGRGVSYCATCDGGFYRNLDVFVVGGGYSAAEESLYLAKIARKVTVFVRKPKFSCAKSIADKVLSNDKIEVKFNTEVVELGGKDLPTYIEYVNNVTNEKTRYELSKDDMNFGTFVLAGHIPVTDMFRGKVDMDDNGYILTDDKMETNIEGVYAAGDLRPKSLRQIVTAVSDGAIAATECEKYVEQNNELF